MTKAREVDYDVAVIVNVIDLCKDMHLMPLPGGLFDQDSLFVHLFEYVGQLRRTREDIDRQKEEADARVAKARKR